REHFSQTACQHPPRPTVRRGEDKRRNENPSGRPNGNSYPWDDPERFSESATQDVGGKKKCQVQELGAVRPDAHHRCCGRSVPIRFASYIWRRLHGASGGSIGNVKMNVAPRDLLFSAHNRPPCDSTIERQMANPMPIPCSFVVKKGSNILSGKSMPWPLSLI